MQTSACEYARPRPLSAVHSVGNASHDHLLNSAKHLHSPEEQLHSLAGSFGYVAPEVLNKKGHGKAVDIWSTGCAHPYLAPSVSPLIFLFVWACVWHAGSSHTSCSVDTRPSGLTI